MIGVHTNQLNSASPMPAALNLLLYVAVLSGMTCAPSRNLSK